MIRAFRRLSVRHFAAERTRTLITVVGVALGVAMMTSVRLMTGAMPKAYEHMIDVLAGKAKLQVTNGEAGVPEDLVESLRRVPGVAATAVMVSGWLPVASMPGEFLSIVGIDMLADRAVRDYESIETTARAGDPLAFLAEPDSIALPTKFLASHGLKVGDRIVVRGFAGSTPLTVRAALAVHSGPATLFDGRIGVMDVFAAEVLFGLDHRVSEIDLVLDPNADVAAVQARAEAVIAGRGAVERPATRGETLDRLLESSRTVSTASAIAAMIVGLYLVFNTMMVAVVQRRRELGILRSLGMTRSAVIGLVLSEALCLGAAGAALGVPLGLAFTRLVSPLIAFSVLRNYGLPFDVPDVSIHWPPVFWGVGWAILCSLLAAVLPAREAVRNPPVVTLRPAPILAEGESHYARAALFGTAILSFGIALRVLRDDLPVARDLVAALVMSCDAVGGTLLAPLIVRELVIRAEVPLARLFGLTGTIASRNLVRHMGRVATTASAFYLSLGSGVFLMTQFASVQYTIGDSIDTYFSDLDVVGYVQSSQGAPNALPVELAAIPGVERVGAVRGTKIAFRGSLVLLAGRGFEPPDPGRIRDQKGAVTLLDGDREEVLSRFARGEGAIVNEAFRNRFDMKPGDELRLPSARGLVRLPILATYLDTSVANMGVILIDRGFYRRSWLDDRVSLVEARFAPGVDASRVTDQIRTRVGARYPMLLFTVAELRREIARGVTAGFAIPFALTVSSFSISLLGIVNSLFACVLDRIREVGVLRALGATRRQILTSVLTEAGTIGAIGALLAAAGGSLFGYFELDLLQRWVAGLRVLYCFPGMATLAVCLAGSVAGALAGLFPARRAARLLPAEVLQYE